jgi:hypothetical protein
MKLTERDRRLFLDIQDYGLLTTNRIIAKHFPDTARTTVLRRLRQLEVGRYIKRTAILDDGSFAWHMTEFGARQLNDKPIKLSFSRAVLVHDIALVDLRLKLEEAGIALAWRSEHSLRHELARHLGHRQFATMTVPDGLMAIAKDHKEAIAIEVELTAKNQSRYRDTFASYARKEELYMLWYVVKSESIAKQLRHEAERYLGHRGTFLCWSMLDEVLRDPRQAPIYALNGSGTVERAFTPRQAAQAVGT